MTMQYPIEDERFLRQMRQGVPQYGNSLLDQGHVNPSRRPDGVSQMTMAPEAPAGGGRQPRHERPSGQGRAVAPSGQPNYVPELFEYTPFEPQTQQVQDDQLMSHHLSGLLDSGSPLMRRAAQQGIDFAASRGLGNSSIAAGNAMGSMIDRAMPIAQFDASRFGNVADMNMSALNQVGMFNQQMGFNYDQLGQQAQQFNATLGFNYDQLSQADRHFMESIGLDRDRFDETVRQFDSQFGEQIRQFNESLGFQNQQLAAQVHSSMMGTLVPILAEVYGNPNLTSEQQNAIANNIVNSIFPGIVNTAWGNIPPGIINPSVIPWAMLMPPMPGLQPPGSAPSQPPSQPPSPAPPPGGSGPEPPPGTVDPNQMPPGWTPEAWQVWQNIQQMQNNNWQMP